MNDKATEAIKPYLEPGEVLLWTGQPKKGMVFEVMDVFKTIYMAVLFLFIGYAVKLMADISILLAIPVGMVFFSGCLLLGIGRFFIDAALRKRTFYGLTNKRVIIKAPPLKETRFVYLNPKPRIDFLPAFNGPSTIDLGIRVKKRGGGVAWYPNIEGCTSLYRLEDADQVHRKIREILESESGQTTV
jgi:hypothetical protein